MEKLNKLKNEIRQAEEKQRTEKINTERHEKIVDTVENVGKKIAEISDKTFSVKIENQNEFPTEIKVNNFGDIELPNELRVTNLNEIKIPKPLSEMSIKKPNWFSLKGISDKLDELKKAILSRKEIDPDKYTKKQNAFAVRLVTRDGKDYYNAGGGGGSSQAGSIPERLIHTNTHTGSAELRVYQENHICKQNTTTTLLGANETFTGEWQDCLNYQEVNVSIDTDKNSALNGLVIQWSADGVTVGDTDTFSIYANSGTNYTPNPAFRYVRVVYTNGAVAQTRFSLMTILRRGATGGSFHRIDSTLRDDSDARLNITVPKLKTAANTYVSQQATTAGNAKVSIEEFDGAVSTDTNKLNVATYLTDENGVQKQMLADTYFDGAPVTIESEHHEIHCGDSITLSHTVDLANGATRDILIIVPNPAIVEKRYHFYIEVTTESETDFKLYETPTTTANGTAIPAYNRNRQDPIVAENEVLFYHTPTVTVVGTLIEDDHWGSGRGVGGGARGQNEWVFKNNTKYLIRINNATANNNYVSVKINYYVHPGV